MVPRLIGRFWRAILETPVNFGTQKVLQGHINTTEHPTMFYSDNILTRKGPLASIWLAAHWDRRLTKTQIVQTNIEHSVRDIVNGVLPPMALRLSGQLLLGVSKIYGRKARYLLEDCADALSRLKVSFKVTNVDMPAHAAKASHSAITMPTAANLDDALAPEPELDLEALLRETAEAPLKTQMTAGQGARRLDLNNFELPRFAMDLPPANEAQLPSDLRMMDDFELGRRGTLEGFADSPLRPSIEVGRRAESPRPSLPFSPLRTPSKNIVNMELERVPLNDEYGYLDEPPMPDVHDAPQSHRESITGRFSDPPMPAVVQTTRTSKLGVSSRKFLPLDTEIEIPNALMQEYVRDTTPILLPKASYKEQFLLQSLQAFHLASTAQHTSNTIKANDPNLLQDYEEGIPEQVPLNDNDYLLGPADFAVDGPIPNSPKSPRVMNQPDEDENNVPQVNRLPSAPASPAKSTRSTKSDNLSLPAWEAGDILGDLERWQSTFSSTKKSVSFDSLVGGARQRQVADTFLQLLRLHTLGMIKAEQLVAFGSIAVTATPTLFNRKEALSA